MLSGEYIEVVNTRNECQLTANLLPLSNVATEVLFQSSFSLCRLIRTTRWLWYGLDEQSTQRTTERDTARTETERVPTRPDDTSPVTSRLYPSKRSVAHTTHALIVPSCVVSSRVLRRPHQGPFRVLTSRMGWSAGGKRFRPRPGAQAAEAIGLKDIPASNDEYTILIKGRKFKD